jgi:hypothetical protein
VLIPDPVNQTSPLPVRKVVKAQLEKAPVPVWETFTMSVRPLAGTAFARAVVLPSPSSPWLFAPDPEMVPSGWTVMRAVLETDNESEVTGVALTWSMYFVDGGALAVDQDSVRACPWLALRCQVRAMLPPAS